MNWSFSNRSYLLFVILLIAGFALALLLMGQVPICKCEYVKIWQGIVQSSENSQHISDWYSFSHIIHGIAFYGLLFLFGKKWPLGLRLVLAILIEGSWELFENTDFVINRYREATISLNYYGDSVINSVFDILFMVLGFYFARLIPVWGSVVIILFLELFTLYFIRDNLALNILMLVFPLESIKQWQMR